MRATDVIADGGEAWVADVGGSHVTTARIALSAEPTIVSRTTAAVATHGDADQILGSISAALKHVQGEIDRCTIALPGPFDYEAGHGTFAGVAKFGAIAGVDLRERLGCLLGIVPENVRFVNDAIAYAIGEWFVSPHRPDRLVCITLGTGVGSAFLSDGRAVEDGPEVPPHGWAHLLTIGDRPLEDSVSTRAIQRRYVEATVTAADVGAAPALHEISVREIAERARGGESQAIDTLDTTMFELGEALGPWVVRFRASEVVVGGSMARSWDVLGPAFERGLASTDVRTDRVTVRASRLFDDAPLIGAAVHG
ncbi:ROK family protein [Humibacter soli]